MNTNKHDALFVLGYATVKKTGAQRFDPAIAQLTQRFLKEYFFSSFFLLIYSINSVGRKQLLSRSLFVYSSLRSLGFRLIPHSHSIVAPGAFYPNR